ncbi:MAG TPA: heavy metal translocating P-type ATPase [Trebonia sp.]|nr:heavy metal translocating P-type ATPase [Trebonia sp.]
MAATSLAIGGMTCASCVTRVERKLNKLDGVTATVNLATETARVEYPSSLGVSDLIAAVERAGYTAAPVAADAAEDGGGGGGGLAGAGGRGPAGAGPRQQGRPWRVLAAGVVTIAVMAIAMTAGLQFPGWGWVALAITTPVVTWGAWPFHRAAAINARHATATMDTLVSLGVTASWGWSLYALASGQGHTYLDVASGITALILVGRYLESRARRRAGSALRALLELGAKDASLLRADGTEARVPVGALKVGDRLLVRPGEKIPADGIVTDGRSAVDVSMITGEPVPVEVGPGDPVTGGCVSMSGRLHVTATRVGSDTQLSQIARMVSQAQAGKADIQRLADRVSAVFVPIVMSLALATLIAWLASGHPATAAIGAAVSVLIIACPCAMGLATPTALLVGTGRGAQLGILINGPEVLESTRRVDTLILDKTGTVTTGQMTLLDVLTTAGQDPAEVLRLAGAVEHASEHPIARAIVAGVRDQLGPAPFPTVNHFHNVPGLGVTAATQGHDVLVGRQSWLATDMGLAVPADLAARAAAAEESGPTVSFVAWDGVVRGACVIGDTLKATSRQAVERLRAMGLDVRLLTGDNEAAAQAVAAALGIGPADVIAGVLPSGKVDVVKALQDAGRVVAMVGDGVNDAAALAQADLGLAMGTGTDAAIEASDITLVRGDLLLVPAAIDLSRQTLATIKGNLVWAFGYNVVAIPVAALGLLSPMIAAAAMAFSSVLVVTNSLRLRRAFRKL